MDSRYKNLATNSLIFAIGGIGAKLITFFLLPLYTHVLSTEEYGIAELVLTMSELMIPLISLSIGDAVLRYGLASENKKSVLGNSLLVLLIGSAVMIVLSHFVSYGPVAEYTHYLIAISIFNSLRSILLYYSKGCGKTSTCAIDSIGYTFLLTLSNIIVLVKMRWGVLGYLASQCIAGCISCLFLLCINRVRLKSCFLSVDKKLLKNMLRYSVPLIANSLSWWIIHSTDKVMIQYYMSDGDMGIYSVASKIPSLINTITFFFSQAWIITAVTDFDKDRDTAFYKKTFESFNTVICLMMSCFLVFYKYFISVYVGKNFQECLVYIPFLLLAAVFRNYSDFFGAFFSSAKKNSMATVSTLLGAVSNVVLNFLLIRKWGIQGAVIATMLSYVIVAVVRISLVNTFLPLNLNYFKTFLCTLIVGIQASVTTFCKSYLPYSVICFLLVIIVNEQSLKSVFAVIKKRFMFS